MITFGCAVKSSVQFTKPPTRTMRLILERSPTSAFSTAMSWIAQVRATSAACSTVRSRPTLPVTNLPSGPLAICPARLPTAPAAAEIATVSPAATRPVSIMPM